MLSLCEPLPNPTIPRFHATRSSDGEDDTAALLRELERIKQERADEAEKKAREREAEAERQREQAALSSNPLLDLGGGNFGSGAVDGGFAMKKSWTEDTVFKNMARDEAKEHKQEWINDTLRSSFHRKFMSRYIQ